MHTDVCNQNFSLFLNLTMCDCMMKVQFAKHSLCVLGLGLLTLTQGIPNHRVSPTFFLFFTLYLLHPQEVANKIC